MPFAAERPERKLWSGKGSPMCPGPSMRADRMSSVNGIPKMPEDIKNHSIIEFIGEIAALAAARWLPSKAPQARISGQASNVPSVLLAVKSGVGLAPLPAPLADHGSRPRTGDRPNSGARLSYIPVHPSRPAQNSSHRRVFRLLPQRTAASADGYWVAQKDVAVVTTGHFLWQRNTVWFGTSHLGQNSPSRQRPRNGRSTPVS